MKSALPVVFWITFLFYSLTFIFTLLRKKKAEAISSAAGLISNISGLIMLVLLSGHAPVFRLFESFMLGAFFLAIMGVLFTSQEKKLPDVRFWVWLEMMLLMGITALANKEPAPFAYDYNDLYIVFFHFLRIAVVAITLFSSALYIQSRFDNKRGDSIAVYRAHQGRNFLILGALLFLTAEYVGIRWCLRGWGDFWQWGPGFFQSTIIVLLFMLAVHVPGSNHGQGKWRPRLGIICGFLILGLIAYRSTL
jgi:ABC-type transport system involved in cytochrome c biogenesis permease subunit